MKRTSPYQIEILRKIEGGADLRRDDESGWYWRERPYIRSKADGRACAGMIRKVPPWLAPQSNGRFQMTDAGRAALAAAKEGT